MDNVHVHPPGPQHCSALSILQQNHSSCVLDVVSSPDRKFIPSASEDGKLRSQRLRRTSRGSTCFIQGDCSPRPSVDRDNQSLLHPEKSDGLELPVVRCSIGYSRFSDDRHERVDRSGRARRWRRTRVHPLSESRMEECCTPCSRRLGHASRKTLV